jgi:hypothetical protein
MLRACIWVTAVSSYPITHWSLANFIILRKIQEHVIKDFADYTDYVFNLRNPRNP